MKALELRVPPVALTLLAGFVMWVLARLGSGFRVVIPARPMIAAGSILAGLVVAVAGVAAFRRAHTTVNPTTPGASSAVVSSGIYGVSRNPMYLGFLLVLVGWGVLLASIVAAFVVPAFVAYMNRFQIQPEERALEAKFGEPFVRYTRRVRRWI